MSEVLDQSLPRDARVGLTVGFLTLLATQAKAVQLSAAGRLLPDYVQMPIYSMAHPVLGYVGASIGFYASRMSVEQRPNLSRRLQRSAIGAVAMNFLFEVGQSVTIASERTQNFMSSQNAPETLKDFCFALGGAAILLFQERRAIWRSKK